MIYLDSNIFIIGALYNDEKGEKAREILKDIKNGRRKAATSALTLDEVFWEIKRHKSKDVAHEVVEAMLMMPNLGFSEVDATVIWKALDAIKKYDLHPRDAIHIACALNHGISTVFSENSDFDKVKEIKRKSL